MAERKTPAEMAGEFLREAGVLVAALGLLEKIVASGLVTPEWTGVVLGIGLLLAFLGGIIEVSR